MSPLPGTSTVRIGATFSWHFLLPRAAEAGSPLVGTVCYGWAALWCHLKVALPRCHLNMAPFLRSWCHLNVTLYTAFVVSPLGGTFLPSYLPNQGHLYLAPHAAAGQVTYSWHLAYLSARGRVSPLSGTLLFS